MTVIRSFVTLLAVCLCIAFAYAVGHGLSSHNNNAYLIGGGLLLAGAALIAWLSRDKRDWNTH